MPVLQDEQQLATNLLGDAYPYWWFNGGQVHWAHYADRAMEEFPLRQRCVDPVAVLSVFSFEYICLDRTMIQGLRRLPWRGSIDSDGVVRYAAAPPHGQKEASAAEIADGFYRRYRRELLGYVDGYDQIYLLLSGGMDSRVMAGTLRQLEREGRIDAPIETVTWGLRDSRDVVYAEQLSDHFGWKWNYAPLSAEHYWNNFELGALALGAEIDPKHLHRMDWFESAPENSLVLAASYGDSVGRTEYSSKHLLDVSPLEPADRDHILKPEVYREARDKLRSDILEIRSRHGSRHTTGWLELERQIHYMRRHLCPAMNIINRWADLKQSFVSPEIFGYMWSFKPECRTDDVYTEVLKNVGGELLDVPWARTGVRYNSDDTAATDELRKGFHRYGYWLRTEHTDKIHDLLFDGTLRRLDIFDMQQIHWLFDEWQREEDEHDTSLCTELSSLAALSLVANRYELQAPDEPPTTTHDLRDKLKHQVHRQTSRASQLLRRKSRPWRLRARKLFS